MNKQDVITFFDYCASSWDARMIRNESVIYTILDHGGVSTGCTVLDVACGTGVLFPDYLQRNVKSVTAVDISPEMTRIASRKYPGSPIRVICGDIETLTFEQKFDCCMVYNAFPAFSGPGTPCCNACFPSESRWNTLCGTRHEPRMDQSSP